MSFNQKETDGLGDHLFHSSRAERHIVGGVGELVKKQGYFARNPAMRIILIDLLLIAIIAIVIVPFILKREGTGDLVGYGIKFKAFEYGDQVMVLLTFKGEGEKGEMVESRFYYEEEEKVLILSDLLPSKGERTLRGSLDTLSKEYIYCQINIGDQQIILKTSIR